MEGKLFNTELANYEERKTHLLSLMDTPKMSQWIEREVRNHQRGEDGYSGSFTDKLGNYLFNAKNITSIRRIDNSFYETYGHYWNGKTIHKHTLLVDEPDESNIAKEYERSLFADRAGYMERLFQTEMLDARAIRSFIKTGLYANDDMLEGLSSEFKTEIFKLRKLISSSCQNKLDKKIISRFDGKKSMEAIGLKYGVSHQSISKRLKKICKNVEKRLRNQNKNPSI